MNSTLNTSGLMPVEYKVLIQPEEIEEKSSGGIIMPDKVIDKENMAQVKGKLIAMGGNAFEDWKQPKPKLGDSIYFAKYAGYVIKSADEIEYRLCNDKDVAAIVI